MDVTRDCSAMGCWLGRDSSLAKDRGQGAPAEAMMSQVAEAGTEPFLRRDGRCRRGAHGRAIGLAGLTCMAPAGWFRIGDDMGDDRPSNHSALCLRPREACREIALCIGTVQRFNGLSASNALSM
jgi:hypothetical protein